MRDRRYYRELWRDFAKANTFPLTDTLPPPELDDDPDGDIHWIEFGCLRPLLMTMAALALWWIGLSLGLKLVAWIVSLFPQSGSLPG